MIEIKLDPSSLPLDNHICEFETHEQTEIIGIYSGEEKAFIRKEGSMITAFDVIRWKYIKVDWEFMNWTDSDKNIAEFTGTDVFGNVYTASALAKNDKPMSPPFKILAVEFTFPEEKQEEQKALLAKDELIMREAQQHFATDKEFTEEIMRILGGTIQSTLEQFAGAGQFVHALIVFPTDSKQLHTSNYISTGEREDMIKAIRATLLRIETGAVIPPGSETPINNN